MENENKGFLMLYIEYYDNSNASIVDYKENSKRKKEIRLEADLIVLLFCRLVECGDYRVGGGTVIDIIISVA